MAEATTCALEPAAESTPANPGDQALSERQRQAAELIAQGLTNRQISRRLDIAEWTAINHVRHVMRKLNVTSRVHVARWFLTYPTGEAIASEPTVTPARSVDPKGIPMWLSLDLLSVESLALAPVNTPKQTIPEALHVGLSVIGAGWLGAYVMAIRRGFRDRLLAIPLVAVAFNVAWEFSYAFVFAIAPLGRVLNAAWFVLDLVIVGQVFMFGYKDATGVWPRAFRLAMAALLVFAFTFMLVANHEFADLDGGYTAFGLNVFLSYSFIATLQRRGLHCRADHVHRGVQDAVIAACALFASWYPQRPLLYLFYLTIFVLDTLYVILLYRRFARDGIPTWRTAEAQRPPHDDGHGKTNRADIDGEKRPDGGAKPAALTDAENHVVALHRPGR